jgi:hypothetical protein
MFVMVSIMCGSGFDVSLLLVPVATLFAITQLRSSMPGAPPGFGRNFSLCSCTALLTSIFQVPLLVSAM